MQTRRATACARPLRAAAGSGTCATLRTSCWTSDGLRCARGAWQRRCARRLAAGRRCAAAALPPAARGSAAPRTPRACARARAVHQPLCPVPARQVESLASLEGCPMEQLVWREPPSTEPIMVPAWHISLPSDQVACRIASRSMLTKVRGHCKRPAHVRTAALPSLQGCMRGSPTHAAAAHAQRCICTAHSAARAQQLAPTPLCPRAHRQCTRCGVRAAPGRRCRRP